MTEEDREFAKQMAIAKASAVNMGAEPEYVNRIPEMTKLTIDQYVSHGYRPGSFIRAVLENDLFGALGNADLENRVALFDIARYVESRTPRLCHGSPAMVAEWIAGGCDKFHASVERLGV